MQVFVDLTRFAATATRAQLRDRVRELEDVGATGVSVSDHIFFTSDGRPRTDGVGHGCDPLTTLAVVAGLSERLAVQTVVVNSAWVHPGLLLRQFAQLAVVLGGDRVTAGLGAGWSAEEFDALGLAMPRFRTRIDRLAEVLRSRAASGRTEPVSYDGRPRHHPRSAPRRRYRITRPDCWWAADRTGSSSWPGGTRTCSTCTATRSTGGSPERRWRRPRPVTWRGGRTPRSRICAGRIGLVRDAAEAAGRPRNAVGVATQIWYVAFGSPAQVRAAEEELCARWAGIPYRPLDRSPYLLLGSPAQMAEALAERHEAYGLERISLSEESGIAAAPADPLRFCREVLPLLG